MKKRRAKRKNPVLDLVSISRPAPSVVVLSHVHSFDRMGEYRGHPTCTGHILTIVWGPKRSTYLGARAVFYKKNGHWYFLTADRETEITPGATAKNDDEGIYQMLAARFLAQHPGKGRLAPAIGHHVELESGP